MVLSSGDATEDNGGRVSVLMALMVLSASHIPPLLEGTTHDASPGEETQACLLPTVEKTEAPTSSLPPGSQEPSLGALNLDGMSQRHWGRVGKVPQDIHDLIPGSCECKGLCRCH